MQTIISGKDSYKKIEEILNDVKSKKFMLVCDSSFEFLSIKDYFNQIKIPYVKFSDFTPNPLYEDVVKGVKIFNRENCDAIVAIGGGSSLDVAKCIKLYSKLDGSENYLTQEYSDAKIPLIALPTTAGTGSESTRFAVIYYEGKKQSVNHISIIPNFAILESSVLKTLPLYQKKCTLLDALCQAIEAWWSVNSTDESKEYSKKAIEKITKNIKEYFLSPSEEVLSEIMLGANFAGRAINITQTTAAHAMSYKLTSLYKIPHGHAVAICLAPLFKFMSENLDKCIDSRGKKYLQKTFEDISSCLGENSVNGAIGWFFDLLKEMEIGSPDIKEEDLEILVSSVNVERLSNNPIKLTAQDLENLYKRIKA